jgi:hypothetical protein
MPFINALAEVAPVNGTGAKTADKHGGYSSFFKDLKPGQHLQATVQTRLPGGDHVVALGGQDRGERQLLHLKLPGSVRAGDLLNLVFISRDPRPAFMLMSANTPTAISVPLSETGRFIDGLVRGLISPEDSPALTGTDTLLKAPPVDGVQLARNLASVLARSGLFYEAHQVQWLAGARPLAELLLEPQARLSGQQMQRSDADIPSNAILPTRDNASDPCDPVHPDTRQPVEWEVAEEKREPSEEHGEFFSAWSTLLRITLPNLGRISARVRLDERGVEVQLVVADPVTAFILRTGTMPLAGGLEAAGIKLLGVGVDLDG